MKRKAIFCLPLLVTLLCLCITPVMAEENDHGILGTYVDNDGTYEMSYIVLNKDGKGMLMEEGYALGISWTISGDEFIFTDSKGTSVTGSWRTDLITGTYEGRKHEWSVSKEQAPVTKLSPDTWGKGFRRVLDQANVLDEAQKNSLNSHARRISDIYNCQVYIVVLDDFHNFSLSDSVETCCEEIKAGYNLDLGGQGNFIMLLLSIADRKFNLMTHGDFANDSFTDYGKGKVQEAFIPDFKDNNWNGGFENYLTECQRLLKLSSEGNPLDVEAAKPETAPVTPEVKPELKTEPKPKTENLGITAGDTEKKGSSKWGWIVAIVVGLLVAKILGGRRRAASQNVREKANAVEYIPENGSSVTHRYDQYTGTDTNRTSTGTSASTNTSTSTAVKTRTRGKEGQGGTSTTKSGSSHTSGGF